MGTGQKGGWPAWPQKVSDKVVVKSSGKFRGSERLSAAGWRKGRQEAARKAGLHGQRGTEAERSLTACGGGALGPVSGLDVGAV